MGIMAEVHYERPNGPPVGRLLFSLTVPWPSNPTRLVGTAQEVKIGNTPDQTVLVTAQELL